jgi:RNA polymerase sigma factor (sigma-70 family)
MPKTRQTPTSTSHHLRVLLESGAVAGLSDGELLDRFTRERDEAAFTALIERHGPMVQRLCSDVMGNHHDAEDAFQATFLVLARHARSIRRPDSIASWLHGVAIRVSAAARSAAARRRTHERNRAALQVEQATVDEPGSDTLAAHVHAEVARLPDRFRGPVVLCYLEGRTYGEAAQLLHCPIGTIKSRLATARERLRRRLKQQSSAAAFAGSHDWEQHGKPHIAAVPISLVESTVAAVMRRGAPTAAALAASTSAVMSAMKLKLVCYSAMAIAALAGIAFAVNYERAENPANPGRPPQRATGLLEQQPATDREIRTVFLRVLDRATRQPLTGVTVTLSIDFKVARESVTDPSGRVVIPLPARNFDHATVAARKDGLPPMRVYLRRPDAPDLEVPRSLALEMGGATSIGGIVRDEAGHPIAGASVKIAELTPPEGAREVFDASAVSTQTDVEGRWRIDVVPADLGLAHLQFEFTHPDFLTLFESSRFQPPPTPEQLRSRRAVTVLTRGVTVSGRVLDPAGRPVAGAAVMLTRRRYHGPTLSIP